MYYLIAVFAFVAVATARPNCQQMCTMQYDPVCGSDGRSYSNECRMRVHACVSGESVEIAYRGRCGRPSAECNIPCPRSFRPVCGTDGRTYSNQCTLNVRNCNRRSQVEVDYEGRCATGRANRRRQNVNNRRQNDNDCPMVCTMEYDPQCGSDGKTYPNKCAFRSASCRARGELTIAKEGAC